MKEISIAVLGSTGSIGTTTLRIIKKSKNFKIIVLQVNKNFNKICKQIKNFNPKIVVASNEKTFLKLKKKYHKKKILFLNNLNNINKYTSKVDVTVSAIPGIAGLKPTLEMIKLSRKMLLANKESIVCGWSLIKKESLKHKTKLIAIDSEHFSIHQLTKNNTDKEIEKIYITASGGPFLQLKKSQFKKIKPKHAIKHPKWKMGKKISIDSATLMNKILELIEAYKLFPFSYKKYEIIIHPQSLVHAIVKFKNGITKLLYHDADMSIPISNAIFENKTNIKTFNLILKKDQKIENLEFYPVDQNRFPMVNLITKINRYKSAPIILNAANEVFVDHFLKSKISFNSIYNYLSLVLKDKNYIKYANMSSNNLDIIYKIDNWSRSVALKIINEIK